MLNRQGCQTVSPLLGKAQNEFHGWPALRQSGCQKTLVFQFPLLDFDVPPDSAVKHSRFAMSKFKMPGIRRRSGFSETR